ncbi:hypothetical protein NDU88_003543 [Pleurodeles waltl]|uniref:Uncharacterized protein n=1 Tax=Pleurodeles waltl TaxID=8319 RepID=A0AAV7PIG2_PLEWA|nr:hypothetical protein NDU88_003543 [Pleurodeles waltl]
MFRYQINIQNPPLSLCYLQTDMQQLVKDSNDPSRFRNVLVPKGGLHKVLEEAKAAQDSAGFLLNGVSEILFSPKELASAKGITKARAGTTALDEEKVDALFDSDIATYLNPIRVPNLTTQHADRLDKTIMVEEAIFGIA